MKNALSRLRDLLKSLFDPDRNYSCLPFDPFADRADGSGHPGKPDGNPPREPGDP